jgi:hypothetical protein
MIDILIVAATVLKITSLSFVLSKCEA